MILDTLLSRDEKICPWWIAWTFDNPLRKWLHDPAKIIGPFVSEGMIVADIGCGMGYFSVAMAKTAGPGGRVISADIQQHMLDICRKRAYRAGVSDRVRTVLCRADDISITETVNFALAFWMVHEVKNIPLFFSQAAKILRPGGKLLYAEPRLHVMERRFNEILGYAKDAGFRVTDGPKVGLSRSAVLTR